MSQKGFTLFSVLLTMVVIALIAFFGLRLNDPEARKNLFNRGEEAIQRAEEAQQNFIEQNKIKQRLAPDVNFDPSLIDHSDKNPLEEE